VRNPFCVLPSSFFILTCTSAMTTLFGLLMNLNSRLTTKTGFYFHNTFKHQLESDEPTEVGGFRPIPRGKSIIIDIVYRDEF